MSRKNALNRLSHLLLGRLWAEHVRWELHGSAACLCTDTLLCVSPMDPEDSGSRCTLSHRSGESTGAFPTAWSGTDEGKSRTPVPWERKRALLQHCVRSRVATRLVVCHEEARATKVSTRTPPCRVVWMPPTMACTTISATWGVLSRTLGMASAHDAQNADSAHLVADLRPNPPILIGKVANSLANALSASVPGVCCRRVSTVWHMPSSCALAYSEVELGGMVRKLWLALKFLVISCLSPLPSHSQ